MLGTGEFTILYNGVEKPLADWGIEDLEFEWENMAPHYVTFTVGGVPIDATTIFPYAATVEIFQNRNIANGVFSGGARWFYGRVEPWESRGTGSSEDQIGRLANPWWYLEHQIFKMSYTAPGGTIYTTSRVVLGVQLINNTQFAFCSTGQQIINALNWAIAAGAPIQIGNVAPWAMPPTDFQKNITCAEVIQKMWRIESDFVVVWDYSTMPYPTIHFLKGNAANLAPGLSPQQQAPLLLKPLSFNLNAGNFINRMKIKPRPDWQKSYVNIDYDMLNTSGQSTYLATFNDHYPDPLPADTESKFRGLDLYFDLTGSRVNITTEQATITTAPFDYTSIAQWIAWKQELAAPTIQSVAIVTDANHPAPGITCTDTAAGGNPVAYSALCNCELLDGDYHDWMQNGTLQVYAQKVRAIAWVQIIHKNGKKEYKQISKDFTAISINTGAAPTILYTQTSTLQQYADPLISGLAKIMYQAFQSLAAEGEIESAESEISNSISFANSLNFLSPTQPAWGTLNAIVQSISGSALRGISQVKFGAPLHLTAQALIDLSRVSRFRWPSQDLHFLFGGQLTSGGGGTVTHPHKTHAHAPEGGADHQTTHVVSTSPNPAAESDPNQQGTISLDTTAPVGLTAPITISLSLTDAAAAEQLNS
jgi:hypothetical protein